MRNLPTPEESVRALYSASEDRRHGRKHNTADAEWFSGKVGLPNVLTEVVAIPTGLDREHGYLKDNGAPSLVCSAGSD